MSARHADRTLEDDPRRLRVSDELLQPYGGQTPVHSVKGVKRMSTTTY